MDLALRTMSILNLPSELHSHILSYLFEIRDQIVAAETCSLWRDLLLTRPAQLGRYKSSEKNGALPPTHKLLLPADKYRLSCTVQNGTVQCYRLSFTHRRTENDDDKTSHYNTKDISNSAFLDEPPVGFLDSRDPEYFGETELGITGSMCIFYEARTSGLQDIECPNTTTVKDLIHGFVKNAQFYMEEGGVQTDSLQEVVFSLYELTKFDRERKPLPAFVTSHVFAGMVVKRSEEQYREWLEFDQNILPKNKKEQY
ncbi:hypothetical protein TWF730_006266 [Orbilia blumenaviensis]|uniref:F-box domain-containing protein n=1 Tax=Orbilia blumenaviensis TaxID=1796055 RepID=A0AAV9VEA2_9PEZI